MLGYTRAELLALTIFAVDADMTRQYWASCWTQFNTQESVTLQRRHRRRSSIRRTSSGTTLLALDAAGLEPGAFELELTESTLMQRVG